MYVHNLSKFSSIIFLFHIQLMNQKSPKNSQTAADMYSCMQLNISSCPYTEDKDSVLTIYNPLSYPIDTPVRIPVEEDTTYKVVNLAGTYHNCFLNSKFTSGARTIPFEWEIVLQIQLLLHSSFVKRSCYRNLLNNSKELYHLFQDSSEVVSQVIPIHQPVQNIPGRVSKAKNELVFIAKVPAMGHKSYKVVKGIGSTHQQTYGDVPRLIGNEVIT